MKKNLIILLSIIFTMVIISACQENNKAAANNADNTSKETTIKADNTTAKAPTEETLAKMAADYPLKETHKDFSCIDCHGEETPVEEYYLISSQSCFNCHGSAEDVAALTPQYDGKGGINPHNSFHLDTRIECYMCHQEHKPSRNYCAQCHDTNVWMPKVP